MREVARVLNMAYPTTYTWKYFNIRPPLFPDRNNCIGIEDLACDPKSMIDCAFFRGDAVNWRIRIRYKSRLPGWHYARDRDCQNRLHEAHWPAWQTNKSDFKDAGAEKWHASNLFPITAGANPFLFDDCALCQGDGRGWIAKLLDHWSVKEVFYKNFWRQTW